MTSRYTRAAAVTAAIAVATTASACSSSKAKSSSSSGPKTSASSTSTTQTDYSSLLIAASDIPVSGFTRQSPQTPSAGTGTSAVYSDAAGTRNLGDTILVFPTADAAATAAQASGTAAKSSLTGGQTGNAGVGSNATLISGTKSTGASTILVFSEGRAEVVLEFDSAANDPVPASVVQQVGTKQDELIKSGLH